ncbi:MAG: hypothetical protein ACK5HS_01895 [Mycoplasmatales bacterium]
MTTSEIEFWEKEYLMQIEYLLKLDKEKMLDGFKTKEYIKEDWEQFLGKSTSDFAVGAERIFYWLFNQFGQPNSSPIGSDLFFETYNAYVHIDIKTVTLANIGDYTRSIFVGNNQVSYKCNIQKQGGKNELYFPCLPSKYTKKTENNIEEKVCLTYFITILYNEKNLEIYNLSVLCVPNNLLYEKYGDKVLVAGKNPGKARFSLVNCSDFEIIGGKRIVPIIHKNCITEYEGITQNQFDRKMKFWNMLWEENGEE